MADAMREAFDRWYADQRHQLSNEIVCRVIWERAWCTAVQQPAQGEAVERCIECGVNLYTAPPAQGEPTCPHCKTVMRPVHFVGYYDEFHFWSCDCEILPNAVKERGGYA